MRRRRRTIPQKDLDLHLIHGSLDPPESTLLTASRSVQPFAAGLTNVSNRHTDSSNRGAACSDTANTLACSIVATRLDYCNAVLYGVTNKNILRLQRMQNSLAMVVCAAPYRCPSAPLGYLHRLPVAQRIIHKVAALTFKTRLHRQPTYLYDLLHNYIPWRRQQIYY